MAAGKISKLLKLKIAAKFSDFQRLRAWLNPHSPGHVRAPPMFPPIPPSRNLQEKWVVIPAWTREERKQDSFLKDGAFAIPGVRPASDSWSRLGAELVALTDRHGFNRRPLLLQRVHCYIAADPGGLFSGALLRERHFLALWRWYYYILKAYNNGSVLLLPEVTRALLTHFELIHKALLKAFPNSTQSLPHVSHQVLGFLPRQPSAKAECRSHRIARK